jgi:hypothetical protein
MAWTAHLDYFEPDEIQIPFCEQIAVSLNGSFPALRFAFSPTQIPRKQNSKQNTFSCALSKKPYKRISYEEIVKVSAS